VDGGWPTDTVPSYCNVSIFSNLVLVKGHITIARAHSFIMKGVSGIDSDVTESMYV
jgi:hypothetical protein